MNRDDINKLADWMIAKGYATGHGETMEDLLAELEWQIAENWNRAMINGITTEREECAKLCDAAQLFGNIDERWAAKCCSEAIRARGTNV
jgi:hypothetical protein